MSFDRSQFRSQTKKKGEPPSHYRAVHFVADFLGRYWDRIFLSLPAVYAPYNTVFTERYVTENKLQYRVHSYDLGCTIGSQPIAIVEIGDIGDDSKHNPTHKQQLINDGIAKKYIEEYFPYCRFYRINKDDAMLELHLKKLFFRYGERSQPLGRPR